VEDTRRAVGEEGFMTIVDTWKRLGSLKKAVDGQQARIDHVISLAGRKPEYTSKYGVLEVCERGVTFVSGDFRIQITAPKQVEIVPPPEVKKSLAQFDRDTYLKKEAGFK
jgi:hypothetical protein